MAKISRSVGWNNANRSVQQRITAEKKDRIKRRVWKDGNSTERPISDLDSNHIRNIICNMHEHGHGSDADYLTIMYEELESRNHAPPAKEARNALRRMSQMLEGTNATLEMVYQQAFLTRFVLNKKSTPKNIRNEILNLQRSVVTLKESVDKRTDLLDSMISKLVDKPKQKD